MSILDFEKELDVSEFDSLIRDALNSSSPTKKTSEVTLMRFKAHPSSWLKIGYLLEKSTQHESHFFVLQILEEKVKFNWNLFSAEQKCSLKNYIVSEIINKAKNRKSEYVLKKLNGVLIQVVKREYPKHWPNFIQELIDGSKNSTMDVCANSMDILKMLCMEVFTFSSNITTVRRRRLAIQMQKDFPLILNFILMVFEHSKTTHIEDEMIVSTFKALEAYIPYLPREYLFQSPLISNVLLFLNSKFSINSVSALTEILKRIDKEKEAILIIHMEVVDFLTEYFERFKYEPIEEVYHRMPQKEKSFILAVSSLQSQLYNKNINFLESDDLVKLLKGLEFLVSVSSINDSRLFQNVLDTWSTIATRLYEEEPTHEKYKILNRQNYSKIIQKIIPVLSKKMPRPQEVFITQNEFGEIVKEKMVETEQIEFYKKMKETIYHLSFLQTKFTQTYFLKMFDNILNSSDWTYDQLNSLSWAVGAVSGSFSIEEENSFFIDALRTLLTLVEVRQTKKDKAVIASNIMYIIGQYYKFLRTNKKFLMTVVKKLFEFMNETHEGIQDMACDTFLTVCKRCSREFLQRNINDSYLTEILQEIHQHTQKLEHHQHQVLTEALSIVIKDSPEKVRHIKMLQKPLNERFERLIFSEEVKELAHILRAFTLINEILPMAVEMDMRIYERVLELYKSLNQRQNTDQIKQKGYQVLKKEIINLLIPVLKTILFTSNLMSDGIDKPMDGMNPLGSSNLNIHPSNTTVNIQRLHDIINTIVSDYFKNPQSKILDLSTKLVELNLIDPLTVKSLLSPSVEIVLSNTNDDITSSYFSLVKAQCNFSFESFFQVSFSDSEFFEALFNTLMYGLGCRRELSLNAIESVRIMSERSNSPHFYTKYFFEIMDNVLNLIFNRDKEYTLDEQISLLNSLLSKHTANDFIFEFFKENHPNISTENVKLFVMGIEDLKGREILKEHLLDYRVKVNEYVDNEDLEDEIKLHEERKQSN